MSLELGSTGWLSDLCFLLLADTALCWLFLVLGTEVRLAKRMRKVSSHGGYVMLIDISVSDMSAREKLCRREIFKYMLILFVGLINVIREFVPGNLLLFFNLKTKNLGEFLARNFSRDISL
jgi:hypothetical protein